MNIEEMITQLKTILPAENFKNQPGDARTELIQFEKTYRINTSNFIQNEVCLEYIPEDIRDKWIKTLDTFINFGGTLKDINHLTSQNNKFNLDSFIKETPKDNSQKEYVNDKSKESGWLPCLFSPLNYGINLHSLIGVK